MFNAYSTPVERAYLLIENAILLSWSAHVSCVYYSCGARISLNRECKFYSYGARMFGAYPTPVERAQDLTPKGRVCVWIEHICVRPLRGDKHECVLIGHTCMRPLRGD